jgi:PDZ domain-containing protein
VAPALLLRTGERSRSKWSRLAGHPLLAGYSLRLIRRVASVADEVKVAPGAVLAKQGRAAEWFFLIETGEAEVVRGADRLGLLGPGAYYGEVALLGRGPHPVTVRAVTTMTMFVIGAQWFLPLVADIHRLRLEMDAALLRQAELVALTRGEHLRRLRPRRQRCGRRTPTSPLQALSPGLRAVAIPPKAMPLDRGLLARRRRSFVGLVLAIMGAIVTVSTLYHPPFAVIAPGPAIDVSKDIAISGVTVHQPRGRYLMLTTQTRRPSLLGLGLALLHLDRSVLPVDQLAPPATRTAQVQRRLRAEFVQSQLDAAAAAARAAGMAVSPTGRLPFAVHFRDRDVVGPSAGLVYALAIEDMLSTTDRGGGRVIAATGEIAPTGAVSGVGYVTEKTETARRSGVQLLLVPQNDIDSTSESGVPVEGVASLDEALNDLAAGSPD